MTASDTGGGFAGFLRRRAQGLWRRIWPLNMRRATVLVLLAFVITFIAFEVRSMQTFTVEVVVVEEEDLVGFNPTTERLDFGDMSRGTGQTRSITLTNDSVIPNRVYVMIVGDVGDFIEISDAFVTLGSGETTQIDLTLVVPEGAEVKKYSGDVLIFRHPWF